MLVDAPQPATEVPAEVAAPLSVFRAACMDGSATIQADKVELTKFRELPQEAKDILRFAMRLGPSNNSNMPLITGEVSKNIYRFFGSTNAFLILPEGERESSFKGVCALIVQGEWYRAAAKDAFGIDIPPKYLVSEHALPYLAAYSDGFQLTAAEKKEWTIVSTVPASEPQSEPVQPSDACHLLKRSDLRPEIREFLKKDCKD